MRQTASGRWVPERKPEPQPVRPPDASYESYAMHVYTCPVNGRPGCVWCILQASPQVPPPPWDLLNEIELH